MDREKLIEELDSGILMARATETKLIHIYVEQAEEILTLLKEQEAEIRQLKLALDIAKGTCKGIKCGQFADMPTLQSAT